MKLSLVVPCYNEEKNVKAFHDTCVKTFANKLSSYEFVFINDGSVDDTWKALKELKIESNKPVKIINFSRNFGKEAAMFAGLHKAEGDYVTVIDADLQQHPEVVLQMVEMLDENRELDCVASYQDKRREGKILSFFKKCFYKMINKMSDTDFRPGASDFRTFRSDMVKAILKMTEYHRFSKGIFSWVGFNTEYIPYVAQARHDGKSTWSFKKLFSYAIEGIVAFTVFPLKLATFFGCLSSILSLIYMLVVVVQKIFFEINVPGYATLVSLVLLLGGIQLITLGVIGEYISKIYIQGKNRPIYIIKNYEGSEDGQD